MLCKVYPDSKWWRPEWGWRNSYSYTRQLLLGLWKPSLSSAYFSPILCEYHYFMWLNINLIYKAQLCVEKKKWLYNWNWGTTQSLSFPFDLLFFSFTWKSLGNLVIEKFWSHLKEIVSCPAFLLQFWASTSWKLVWMCIMMTSEWSLWNDFPQ